MSLGHRFCFFFALTSCSYKYRQYFILYKQNLWGKPNFLVLFNWRTQWICRVFVSNNISKNEVSQLTDYINLSAAPSAFTSLLFYIFKLLNSAIAIGAQGWIWGLGLESELSGLWTRAFLNPSKPPFLICEMGRVKIILHQAVWRFM